MDTCQVASLYISVLARSSYSSGQRCCFNRKIERAVIKYLQKKRMSPSQIHQDMTSTLGESTVSYGIAERWCRMLKCGRTSCEDEHSFGLSKTVTTPENINKVYDLVLPDRRVTI
ncbi:hypothetical protein ANN_25980 [Periplaneta americana]|uniref:Mos1 transposase HTH domain-containing protein n=1 Tax=Periplaneta americana TaxID=6978 RepID=A0ABQ8S4N4_PERAM|nr:hypothetical protein ANN_25980 [Periplaneta americana]